MGYIYIAKALSGPYKGDYRIGKTVNIEQRMKSHTKEWGCTLQVIATRTTDDTFNDELNIHADIEQWRIHPNTLVEWFCLSDDCLYELINRWNFVFCTESLVFVPKDYYKKPDPVEGDGWFIREYESRDKRYSRYLTMQLLGKR